MTKARKFKNIVLCQRDFQILRLIFESKIVSREQIANQFFPDVSAQTVSRRLLKISGLGLIRRSSITTVDNKIICAYSLTQGGLTKIKPLLAYEVKTKSGMSECPLHDIALNDIRCAFEAKSAVQNYYTENVLQTCTGFKLDEQFRSFVELNSDAMAEVNTRIGGLNLAIELDTIHKSKDRYQKKISAYYFKHRIDGVLYICASKYILDRLFKIDKAVAEHHKCEHKLYFALLEDVTGATGELIFTNAKRGIFVVK